MPPPFDRQETIDRVRLFMRDNASLNALLNGQETTDALIDLAIDMTTDDFSITTPVIATFTLDSFPSLYLLIYGTVINVLRSAGILQSRNNLNYSDGGITVASSDKTALYQSWIDRFYQDYESKKKNFLIQTNAEQAFSDGIISEYFFLDFGSNNLQFGI